MGTIKIRSPLFAFGAEGLCRQRRDDEKPEMSNLRRLPLTETELSSGMVEKFEGGKAWLKRNHLNHLKINPTRRIV
jgi:hypothetical protein